MSSVSAALKNSSDEAKYDVPQGAMRIPLDSTPSNLSALVNHLLGLEEEVPFKFFVHGVLLHGPLTELLSSLEHTTEMQVLLEYTPDKQLPEDHREQACPDWIRCVHAQDPRDILAGSFDAVVRIYPSAGGAPPQEYPGHRAAVTGVCWMAQGTRFASCSSDWTLRLWSKDRPAAEALLKGHEAAVQCMAYDPAREVVVSGDFDGKLGFWSPDLSKAVAKAEPMPSKKKAAKAARRDLDPTPVISPLSIVSAHSGGHVSAVCMHNGALISAGLDHKLHSWDLERRIKGSTWTIADQVSAMARSSGGLLGVASPDGNVRFVDDRMAAVGKSSTLHAGWINALAFSPTDDNLLCSAGSDLRVCLWDRRGLASGPLKTLAEGTKMLALDWASSGIFFGGEDCILHSYR